MILEEAEAVAVTFIGQIRRSCEMVEVAGSIRRRKENVGDIEIVCKPAVDKLREQSLFGEELVIEYNMLEARLKSMLSSGVITLDRFSKDGRKPPFGPRYYRLTYGLYPTDVFAVLPPAEWSIIFTIRTGSKDFSHWLVTEALRKGMQVKDGRLLKNGVHIPCPTELHLFKALGLEWIPPEKRDKPPSGDKTHA